MWLKNQQCCAQMILSPRATVYSLPGAILQRIDNLFTVDQCQEYHRFLSSEIEWQCKQISIAGKIITEPRYTAFIADEGVRYTYSGRPNYGTGWHPVLAGPRDIVMCACEKEFGHIMTVNAAHLNRYDGPHHSLGFHSDDEPDLEGEHPIVSVSFGATRTFQIQSRSPIAHRSSQIRDDLIELDLPDGCVVVMAGEMQQNYKHAVPAGDGVRYNITFRRCRP